MGRRGIPLLLLLLCSLCFRCESSFQCIFDVDELARFAVEEHNKKEDAVLEFSRVVKAKLEEVTGTLHHLTVEAVDIGKKKLYEVQVWVKPWMDFKKLQAFRPAGVGSIIPAYLGVRKGWQTVPADDPLVEDAANHVMMTAMEEVDCECNFELLEILHPRAQVTEDGTELELFLKMKAWHEIWFPKEREEILKVNIHKTLKGPFNLTRLDQNPSLPHKLSDG